MPLVGLSRIILLLCCFSVIHSDHIEDCPNRDLISPCTWKWDSYYKACHFYCSDMKTDTLNNLFKKIGPNQCALTVSESYLFDFPSLSLANSAVKWLYLENSTVSTNSTALPCLNITQLILINVNSTSGWFYDKMPNLIWIQLENCQRQSVVGVDEMATAYNRDTTASIEQFPMENMSKVLCLELYDNHLKLDARTFPSSLTLLFTYGNKINFIEEGTFSNLPNLGYAGLRHNNLTTLDENVYRDLWKSSVRVSFEGNPINCTNELLWMIKADEKPNHLDGQCSYPHCLEGKLLKDLTVEDLEQSC